MNLAELIETLEGLADEIRRAVAGPPLLLT